MADEIVKVIDSTSTEYVECLVEVFDRATSLPVDVSGDPVSMAFTVPGVKPGDDDWRPAVWTAAKYAGILVGPENGGVVLDPGDYDWRAKVTDSPEVPVFKVGTLRVE